MIDCEGLIFVLINPAAQCNKPIDLQGTVIAISYSTTVDILTDVLSKSLPYRPERRPS